MKRWQKKKKKVSVADSLNKGTVIDSIGMSNVLKKKKKRLKLLKNHETLVSQIKECCAKIKGWAVFLFFLNHKNGCFYI